MSDRNPLAEDFEQTEEASRRLSLVTSEQEKEDLRWLMAQPQGRRNVWRFLAEGPGVFTRTFTTNNSLSSYESGRQEFGKVLTAKLLSWCPDRYLAMVREAEEHDRNRDAASRTNQAR